MTANSESHWLAQAAARAEREIMALPPGSLGPAGRKVRAMVLRRCERCGGDGDIAHGDGMLTVDYVEKCGRCWATGISPDGSDSSSHPPPPD